MPVKNRSLIALTAITAALHNPAARAEPAVAAPCVIVHGQGMNMATNDPLANDMWNELNRAFTEFVNAELKARGRRTIPMPDSVQAQDVQVTLQRILKRAHQNGCDTLVETALFVDPQAQTLVSRLRVHPIVMMRNPDTASTHYRVGEELFAKDQVDPLTRETLERLVPSDIAKRLVRAYVAGPAR